MKILSIDTAHGVCSVAIGEGGSVISEIKDDESSKQAERLVGYIEGILAQNQWTYDDLGAVAVNIVPGSFTGIRIGVAAANGIGLAKNIPVFGVGSLEAMAYNFANNPDKANMVAVLDARRNQLFMQVFSFEMQPLSEAVLLNYDDISTIIPEYRSLIMGNGAIYMKEYIANAGDYLKILDDKLLSDAASIYKLSNYKLQMGLLQHEASPLYVRKPDAKPSK